MSHKLDIFATLRAIDARDFEFLDRQSPEARKGFAPPVVLRWASSVQGRDCDRQVVKVNEVANRHFWDLSAYPDLQYRLIAACGLGPQRHQWIAMAGRTRSASKVHQFLARYWPDANDDELGLLLGQFTPETYREFVLSRGLAPSETAEAIADYDTLQGVKAGGGKKKTRAKS